MTTAAGIPLEQIEDAYRLAYRTLADINHGVTAPREAARFAIQRLPVPTDPPACGQQPRGALSNVVCRRERGHDGVHRWDDGEQRLEWCRVRGD